ncbi:GerAB/ArcD/ProY family transporter [Ornithinibacillus xuwenensis]|uniref:Endospore germination permease n=1 Tax=Ornithinibacillus xuwenensis TaxID=3144668 RepID=A0ABU9XL72_9BACI
MHKHHEKVTPLQLGTVIASTIIGVSILALPRFVVLEAGKGAPLASLVGITLVFIGLLGIVMLGRRFPEQTLIGYNQIILGKPFGSVISVLFIVYMTILLGLEARQFGEVIAGSLLTNTPIQIPIFIIIFLCAVSGLQNVSTFVYIHLLYIPLIVIPIILIIFPSLKDVAFYHLTPIVGHHPSVTKIVQGGLIAAQAISNVFIISMLIPSMKNPKKCIKSSIVGFWIGSITVFIIVTMCLAVFGEEEIKEMFWPTLILGRMVNIPAELLSRVDAILLISWIYAVFTTLLSVYFFVIRGVAELFRFERYRLLTLLIFPVVFAVALIPNDIFEMYEFLLYVTKYGLILTIGYPVFLWLIACLRRKREES